MNLDPVKNFAKVKVSIGYNSTATSIVLTSGGGAELPDPSSDGSFNLVWWNSTDYPDPADDPDVEIVRCTARSTDTLTVTRAQESTSGSNKNIANKVYKMVLALTKKMIDNINTGDVETPTGTINGNNKVFTVTQTPKLLFLNGAYQTDGGEDYTLSTLTITFVLAPATGSVLRSIF